MDIYQKFFRKYAFFLVAIVLIGLVLGLVTTKILPESYDVSLALDIEHKGVESPDFYTYDGYYAIQSTELFGKNVATWFVTPDFVEDVLKNAEQQDIENLSVKDFRRFFTAEQVSSNIVEVTFRVQEQNIGQLLTQAINTSIELYIDTRAIQNYTVSVGEPVIRQTQYNPFFYSLGGAILALALGLSLASFKEYFWR